MAATSILITGGNRGKSPHHNYQMFLTMFIGLGLGLVKHYLALPNQVVVAGFRNPAHLTCKELSTLPKDATSSIVIVQIESGSKSSAIAAVDTLQTKYGIDRLDVIIANAGIATAWPTVADASVEDMLEHYRVNVIGPVVLFQATLPLLSKAANGKFAVMSSSRRHPRKIYFENEKLVVLATDPGWVRTEMGNVEAVALGFDTAEIEVDESIRGVTKVIKEATREESSGRFWIYIGEESKW
ncbi:related to aflatoxin biosynthesis ketoreductase nor-1 [Phialocephala subalpina]|uniref:Related to aflatoxin biosynthesis ketoreductase nor-1 n=1 Tax=Phialocephala subalpina TaxID=576137 RepID=A0A1L7X1J5_9HELO|nr:related to aflatoxin biosynthesis ketoreductase nor-1 [Phialocephala subalpina]